ncbi:MAG: aromatic ring-hydroxylating dioxygenase subunit alpha [Gammaproteobacteria bacterium]|nr:aromatic ring-hydroxylating dioxygenase subunit alpha [Gammaproteobacteria bacterium]
MSSKPDIQSTPMDKAPDPELGAERIPVDRYTDPAFMKLEDARIWSKTWLLAGAACDVAEPGDYFVFENLRESILVVRALDGEIRAFYNVCQHRGNQLRAPGCGHSEQLACAFHLWTWNLDGTLKSVPEAHDFPQGTPADELGLQQLRCDTWGGFVWVSMDPDIEPLLDYLGVVPEHLAPYEFDEMVLVSDETVEWNCNWKTSVDIFSETYHVRGVHPESEFVADDVNVQMDLYGRHTRFIAPMYIPSPRKIGDDKALNDTMIDYLKSEGFPVDDFSGDVTTLRGAVAAHKRAMTSEHGLDFSRLTDDQLTADYHYNIFPNVTFNLFGEQMWMFRHRPHPTDPDKMYFDRMIFNRVPTGEVTAGANAGAVDMFVELGDGLVEGRPEHIFYRHGERSSGLLLDQDASCLAGVQKGLHSRGMKGLWISHHERRIRNFHHWWEKYMEA